MSDVTREDKRVKRVRAYSFDSPMTLPEICVRLNELGPWRWIERENDRWGSYISARALPDPDYGMLKIIVDMDRFVVDLVLESQPAKVDAVCETLLSHLLPGVQAIDLTESDHYE